MSLYKYFKSSLPTVKETGKQRREKLMQLGILSMLQQPRSRKLKAYSVFSDEQRATIGQYAAENSTAAAMKKPVISAHHS